MNLKSQISPTIREKLDAVRALLRRYLWWHWLAMVVCWLLLVFWLGAALDYLPIRVGASEMPRWVRIGLLCLMAVGAAWLLVGWLAPRLLKRVRDSSLALLIERKYPQLNSELVTAVELTSRPMRKRGSEPPSKEGSEAEIGYEVGPAHEAMLQRVLQRAEESIQQVVPNEMFNWRPVKLYTAMAILGTLATLAVALVHWDWFSLLSQRLIGLSDQPWPRQALLRADWLQTPMPAFAGQLSNEQTRIKFKDGTALVPSGASLLLQVSADSDAARVPEICTLYYQSDDGTRGRANLRRIGAPVDGWQQFNFDGPPLDGLVSNLSLDVIGLDARLRDLKLEVVERIVVVGLKLDCIYPKYLLDSFSSRASQESLEYRSGLKIPEGTDCTLVGSASTPLRAAQYTRRATSNESESASAELEILEAQVSEHQFYIPLGQLRASQLVEVRLVDEHGLPAEQILRYHIVVVPDTIPEVQSHLEGIGLAITPRAVLPIRGTVTDDHAVAEVSSELSVDEHALTPIALQLDDRELRGEIDFQQMAEQRNVQLRPGMTVGLSVVATDHFDLDAQPHAGRGQPVQLAVVDENALLVLLDRQELELRQRLEQIISELNQLNEAIHSLAEQIDGIGQTTQVARESLRFTVAGFQSDDEEDGEKMADIQQAQRMSLLRAQQSQLQADKSRQELAGIANRVEHLRLQLAHNRIDSLDRQQRLLERVETPLNQLLAGEYTRFDRSIAELVSATSAGQGKPQAVTASESLLKILVGLEAIKSNMLDIESFNEVIDLVRGLLDQQEKTLKETEDTQKSRVLDLFK